MGLTFEKLKEINQKRNLKYFPEENTNWTEAEWTNAIQGEAGEAGNIAKKRSRWQLSKRNPKDNIPPEELGKELADTVLYCDLLATKLGLNLEDLIINKFNEVSDRYDCEIKL